MLAHLLFFFCNFSLHESAQFCKSPCTFFRTKTTLQNSQEPHKINVFEKSTSEMIDENSLPYYQDRRKGGLHPPFRVPSAPSFPPACVRFFIAFVGVDLTYRTAIHQSQNQNHQFYLRACLLTCRTAIHLFH